MITGVALDDYHAAVAPALKSTDLLEQTDHEPSAVSLADHDDEPVTLLWSPEHNGYGYFSPSAGWVTVPGDRLITYRVNFEALFDRMLARLDLPSRSSPVALVPDLLWEVEDARLPGRDKRAPLWIGRRLADPVVWARFVDIVRARPAPGLRIVLSLSPTDRLPAQVHFGHSIVGVRDVAEHGGLAVDPDLLAARVASGPRQSVDAIVLAADGGAITIRGRRYTFPGSKQRAIIRQLFDAHESGQPQCLTAEILEAAGYRYSVNTLAKAFSRRDDWREFIKENDGHCWLFL